MNNPEPEITIEEIIDSFSARLEDGERPSIEEYKQQYPNLAERIDAILPALVALEDVDSSPAKRKLAVDDSIPELLGDYQIVQEVGRGGMGIVFEAIHTTMRRRVALKVLPRRSSDNPKQLERFQMEARSAGQLHHTNIVPVFEVGEAEGIHFYAMQFIHGENLDRIIEDIGFLRLRGSGDKNSSATTSVTKPISCSSNPPGLSHSIAQELLDGQQEANGVLTAIAEPGSEPAPDDLKHFEKPRTSRYEFPPATHGARSVDSRPLIDTGLEVSSSTSTLRSRSGFHRRVAAVGVQVAQALEYAHDHGVLHRDVKPANLILDTEGNVWVADFGLAKLEASDLTQTGDIVGTLRYMAPERFAGDADARSDIYSLGLTLYELCTLKCAFANDRGTLVQDVASSSSVVSPRKIDETIPPDLETIILKSIEPQPERRYQTAADLAEDLQLFLADRPVKARRASLLEKAWRVCRRNPLASSLAACIGLLLVLTTVGSIQFARSETQNRKESQQSLFYSKLDQAKMRRYSRRSGQRFETMRAISDAVALLPEMDFTENQESDIRFLLRSEVAAAMSLTDIDRFWSRELGAEPKQSGRVAVDITGRFYAFGYLDGRIHVHSISDDKLVCKLPGGRETDPPWAIQFSPNGRFIVSRYHQPNVHNEFRTIVWDLESGGTRAYVTKHTNNSCFSHDSCLIAVSYDDRVEIVRLADGKVINTVIPDFLAPESGGPRRVAFNSDATALAISQLEKGLVEFWNIASVPQLTRVIETKNNVYSLAWDSERQIFVIGSHKGDLYYWLGSLEKEPVTLQLHQNNIIRVHIHPDHELVATTAWDNTTRFTDLMAGEEVLRIENHQVLSNGFCTNGRLGLVTNEDLAVWDVALPLTQVYAGPEREGNGFTCCVHPSHPNIVARTIGDDIEFWNTSSRDMILQRTDIAARRIVFSLSGDYFFSSGENGLERWDVLTDGTKFGLDNQTTLVDGKTGGICLSRDGNSMLVGVGNRPRLLDSVTGELLQEFGSHNNLSGLSLTVDNRYALTGTWHGYGIKIWDTKTGELVQTIQETVESSLAIPHPTRPNTFYAGRHEPEEFFIDRGTGKVTLRQKLQHTGPVNMAETGKLMTIKDSSFNIILIDPETNQDLANIVSSGQSRIINESFSPDGNLLALACFDGLQVLDLSRLRRELAKLGLDW